MLANIKKLIDHILVIGDRKIFDLPGECETIRGLEDKLNYLGFLCPDSKDIKKERYGADTVFVQIGGGGGGYKLLSNIIMASQIVSTIRQGMKFDIITGKYISTDEMQNLNKLCNRSGDISLSPYTNRVLEKMKGASLFLGSGRYSTLCEIIEIGCDSIVIPRQFDRGEQILHSEGLHRLGYVRDVLSLDSSPEEIAESILRVLDTKVYRNTTNSEMVPLNKSGIRNISTFVRGRIYGG